MKKILTSNVKFMMGIIVGILCSGITVYAAYNYLASEVSYSPSDKTWKVDSVEEALNELHKQSKNNSEVYGVVRELNTPSSQWARIGASEGLVANAQIGATPVKNDFDTIYPWSDIISYNYDTDTKQITAYYGEENFTFTPTGNVEVLTRIPEFYYKRYQDDTYEYIYISKNQREGYTKSEEFSIGRYTMSKDATRVHSRSGVMPLANTTITDFRTYAEYLGEEFSQLDYHYFLLQLLYLVEYADYNSQMKLGSGYTNESNTDHIKSGGCDALGMKSGSADGTDRNSVIYRGIEDIFGNFSQFVDGINIKDNQAYICYDKNQYQSDKFDGCYQKLGYVNSNRYETAEFASKLGYDASNPLVAFPIETNGSSNTYVTDTYWTQANGDLVPNVGGNFAWDNRVGLWYWNVRLNSSQINPNTSARLIKTS